MRVRSGVGLRGWFGGLDWRGTPSKRRIVGLLEFDLEVDSGVGFGDWDWGLCLGTGFEVWVWGPDWRLD